MESSILDAAPRTGISAAYALQIGAVLEQATWSAIRRYQVYDENPLTGAIYVSDGAVDVPERPGLGVQVDTDTLKRYRVDPPESRPTECKLIKVIRKEEEPMYFTGTSQMLKLVLKGESHSTSAGLVHGSFLKMSVRIGPIDFEQQLVSCSSPPEV